MMMIAITMNLRCWANANIADENTAEMIVQNLCVFLNKYFFLIIFVDYFNDFATNHTDSIYPYNENEKKYHMHLLLLRF